MPAEIGSSALAWKSVLIHVDNHPSAVHRLEAAAALARQFDALLIGLGGHMLEPVVVADAYGYSGIDPSALEALREQAAAQLAQAERAFQRAAEGLRTEWRVTESRPTQALAHAARAADVIVAGGVAVKSSDHHFMADPAELALISGRPVMIVPDQPRPLAAKRAVIAWKESRESRTALAAALPLLVGTEEVLVVEICGKDDAGDATNRVRDVASGLQRHGVKARGQALVGPDAEVAALLHQSAASVGADLIVAGCYGRSRVNEWLFGGATLDLLAAPERYLLVNH